VLAGVAGATGWWWTAPDADPVVQADLPVPPFPPRLTEGSDYEACLAALADDPDGAIAIADSWQSNGGGEGATHCRGLALIAIGRPDEGAAVLEDLGQKSSAPPLARASLLYQAAQARLMVEQAAEARSDATKGLALSPDDVDLMIIRAAAEAALDTLAEALQDLTDALALDAGRAEALVARATLYRKQGRTDLAQADIDTVLRLDPDDPDALLERGILRQRAGNLAGARADWEHARGADPDSLTADRAEQNLSLLDAGPAQSQ
jgi:tetratricopeptide (TPR) repeat protein